MPIHDTHATHLKLAVFDIYLMYKAYSSNKYFLKCAVIFCYADMQFKINAHHKHSKYKNQTLKEISLDISTILSWANSIIFNVH